MTGGQEIKLHNHNFLKFFITSDHKLNALINGYSYISIQSLILISKDPRGCHANVQMVT